MNPTPASGSALHFSYPQFTRHSLGSTRKLVGLSDAYLPQVTVQISWPRGSAHDPDQLQGLTALTVEMLKEGTESRSSRAIAEDLDRYALEFEVEVEPESTHLVLTALEPQLERGLDLLSELTRQPAFPELELQRVKSRWHSLLVGQRAHPGFLATEALLDAIFPGHPYARAAIPVENLARISADDLRDRARTVPGSGAIFGWAGRFHLERAEELTRRRFPTEDGMAGVESEENPAPASPRRFPVYLVDRPGSVQAQLALGRSTLTIRDPRYLSLKLANQALGGGGSSRLFMNLREDKGLTYGIYSQLRSFRQAGLLVISASLQAEAAGAGLSEVFREMRNLAESAPAGSELDRARAELAGSFLRLLETPAAAVALELRRELALLPENYYADYLDRLTAVTSAELARLAADWFRPEDWCVVVVGDRRVLTPQLEKLGEVRLLKCGATRLETMEES